MLHPCNAWRLALPVLSTLVQIAAVAADVACAEILQNVTCVINQSQQSLGAISLVWSGDIVVAAKTTLQGREVQLSAGRTLTLDVNATVHATGGNVLLQASSLNVSGVAIGTAATGHVQVNAGKVVVWTTNVTSGSVEINATDSVAVSANFFGFPGPVYTSLNVTTPGKVVFMPSSTASWRLKTLHVKADEVVISGQSIHTEGSSCNNRQAVQADICQDLLQGVGPGPRVSLDLAVVATSSLKLDRSRIYAASMALCGGKVDLQQFVTLDASGRGCAQGQGQGLGQPGGGGCGAGGGSFVGQGGAGMSVQGSTCAGAAAAGRPYGNLTGEVLPTQGASGGGCRAAKSCVTKDPDETLPSAGGGLIWLSSSSLLSMTGGVQLLADGHTGSSGGTDSVSGGGAGGQVLIYADTISPTNASNLVKISAGGGGVACTLKVVSGAGGGGFVGLHYGSQDSVPQEVTQGLMISAHGGGLQDCAQWYSPRGVKAALGADGLVASLRQCQAGSTGVFCSACEAGTWSNGTVGGVCIPCENKPHNAEYTMDHWPNSTCPYSCPAGLPNVRSNPQCLSVPGYIMGLFGGFWGCIGILGCLVLLSTFFLLRRTKPRGRQRMLRRPSGFPAPAGPCRSRIMSACSRLTAVLARWSKRCPLFELALGATEWRFGKDELPKHIGRIYLHGTNCLGSPWKLPHATPASVLPLVVPAKWEELVSEVNSAAVVTHREKTWEVILRNLYLPLAPIYCCWCRRQRARKVALCVQRVSSLQGAGGLWKPLRAQVASGELWMVFGFDYGATMGFLDLFDMGRSVYNWSVDLRSQVRLLVAQGHASEWEPLTLDVTDPLVQSFMQTDLSLDSVCTVIAAFNRKSRQFRRLTDRHLPGALSELREAVEDSARHCGISNFVQVVTTVFYSDAPMSRLSEMCLEEAPGLVTSHGTPAAFDGVEVQDVRARSRSEPAVDAEHPLGMAKVGLAFADWAALGGLRGEPLRELVLMLPQTAALSSPMPSAELVEHLDRSGFPLSAGHSSLAPSSESRPPSSLLTGFASSSRTGAGNGGWLRSYGFTVETSSSSFYSSTRWCRWLRSQIEERRIATPTSVLLAVVAFMFVDMLGFAVVGQQLLPSKSGSFYPVSFRVSAFVWLFVPPLAQILAILLVPLFLLWEAPRFGRVVACLVLLGMVNAALGNLSLLLAYGGESVLFELTEMVAICAIKWCLFQFLRRHVRNLEEFHDLSFLSVSQMPGCDPIGSPSWGRTDDGLMSSYPEAPVTFDEGQPGGRQGVPLQAFGGAAGDGAAARAARPAAVRTRSPSPLRARSNEACPF